MKSNKWSKLRTTILIFLISLIAIIIHVETVKATERNIIRVGYVSDEGFIEKKGDYYTGYLYDYLREISIYTNWEYEFVEMDISEALNALKNGEIDLMGGMFKSDAIEKIFDFPKYDMGYTYSTLIVSDDYKACDESAYVILDGMNVGYLETAKGTLDNFLKFCENNGIQDVVLTPLDSKVGESGLKEALKAKEVDAVIGGDLTTNGIDGKAVAKFGAVPYYFATTKGNTEIVEKLNEALIKIDEQDGSFKRKLYDQYFRGDYKKFLILSKKEEAYIKEMQPLKVAYLTSSIPFQYYNKKTQKPDGIFVEYMNLIAQKTNIPIDFIGISSYKEGYELLRSHKVDIMLGALDDYLIADQYQFCLTRSLLRLDIQEIINKNMSLQQDKNMIALKKGANPSGRDNNDQIKYYDTLEECIQAVNKGEASKTYVDSYTIGYYTLQDIYRNIAIQPSEYQIGVSLGLAQDLDETLMHILTQSLASFTGEDNTTIVSKEIIKMSNDVSLKQFIQSHLEAVILIIVIVLTVIAILIKARFDKLKEVKRILLEKTQLDGLTGIYNRETCERLVEDYLKKKDPSLYAALIIIDIDHFKQVNDRFGHTMGDHLLVEFSSILNQFFSHKDIVSRLGGDEFTVFMTDIDKQDIGMISDKLEQLCGLINREVAYNGETQKISLSVGAVITEEDIEFEKLYMMADEMLYEVKRNGRNGFKIKDISKSKR